MTFRERMNYLQYICGLLTETTSSIIKHQIIEQIQDDCRDDFNYIVEILTGKHKLGYAYCCKESSDLIPSQLEYYTFRQYVAPLFYPIQKHDLSNAFILACVKSCRWFTIFVSSIVNRTLKLGIGNSLIEKTEVSPMLAKKYEGQDLQDPKGVYITEKLDGNRCISQFIDNKWVFTSRNGKTMNVNFDMTGFDKSRIYDGEVLSRIQTSSSIKRAERQIFEERQLFNETSGLINSKGTNKDLVYNIFDIVDTQKRYYERRAELDALSINISSSNVRILPVLKIGLEGIIELLEYIVSTGGEGLMLNLGSAFYEQKRTDKLLKLKKVQTMDMQVVDLEFGTGKNESVIGSLHCVAKGEGKEYYCKVGSGLNDYLRAKWAMQPSSIMNKIIEVQYFSISQDKNNLGTNRYSLRFPRFKGVRDDKRETSVY